MTGGAPAAISAPLLTLNLLAAAVWVGGLVALVVVARVARATLDPRAQLAFFRMLGRRYGMVGGAALLVAIVTGALLLRDEDWTGSLTVLAALTAALVLATALGVAQARWVNRLRERQYREPADPGGDGVIARQAARAGILRAAIAAITLAIVLDVAVYVSNL
jgi:putative copper export protein